MTRLELVIVRALEKRLAFREKQRQSAPSAQGRRDAILIIYELESILDQITKGE